jgi:hypothetical protein
MLGVLHIGIAMVTKTPEMVLEDSEAQTLAKAAVPVLDQFNFVPDPRFAAAFGLVVACGQIYGPRFMLINDRRKSETKARPKPTNNAAQSNGIIIEGDFSGMKPGTFTT